jgi:hypothetical protein
MEKFSKLQKEVKNLIALGSWSLYRLEGASAPYLLVNPRCDCASSFHRKPGALWELTEEGLVIRERSYADLGEYKCVEVVNFEYEAPRLSIEMARLRKN